MVRARGLSLNTAWRSGRYIPTLESPLAHSQAGEGESEREGERETWLSREDRLCAHCPQNEVETELHFLTSCQMCDHIRDTYFPQITHIHKEFENKPNFDKLPYLLGEIPQCASQQQDVWPVATKEGQPVKNKSNQIYLYSPSYISWYLKVLYRNPA